MTKKYKKLNDNDLEETTEIINILGKEELINERDYYSAMWEKVNSKIALFILHLPSSLIY